MYDKKLKYKILSIFAAAVMTFTAITPVWAEEENLEADASGETSSDTSEENAAPEIAGLLQNALMCIIIMTVTNFWTSMIVPDI